MIIHRDIGQRSDEWHQLRIGRCTGTRFKELMTGKPPTVETLARKIAAEKITGKSADQPFKISGAMEQGVEREAEARACFETDNLVKVDEVGFIEKDDLFGVSPDGITDDNRGFEVKCPLPGTHIGYLMDIQSLYKAYKWQVLSALWVSGFDSWFLCSYCPEFDVERRLLVYNVALSDKDRGLIDEKTEALRARVGEILEAVGNVSK